MILLKQEHQKVKALDLALQADCCCRLFTDPPMCMNLDFLSWPTAILTRLLLMSCCRVQVNLAAESGEMGVLANHVPSIEQLKPGVVEIIEESGGTKQYFRTCSNRDGFKGAVLRLLKTTSAD